MQALNSLATTYQKLQDETKLLIVEQIATKASNLSDRERAFVFNYIREGDLPENLRKKD